MGSHSAVCFFPPNDSSSVGHFPGNPIIPGAAILREVLRAVTAGRDSACCEVRGAKFLHPVRPNETVTIVCEETASGDIGFTCATGTPEQRVVTGTLRPRAR